MMKLRNLMEGSSHADLDSIARTAEDLLLVIPFNIGIDQSRKTILPLAKLIWSKRPGLQVIGVHVQLGEKDFLPGQVLRVVRDSEIPFDVYYEEKRKHLKENSSLLTRWSLYDGSGRKIRSFSVEEEADLEKIKIGMEDRFSIHSRRIAI